MDAVQADTGSPQPVNDSDDSGDVSSGRHLRPVARMAQEDVCRRAAAVVGGPEPAAEGTCAPRGSAMLGTEAWEVSAPEAQQAQARRPAPTRIPHTTHHTVKRARERLGQERRRRVLHGERLY